MTRLLAGLTGVAIGWLIATQIPLWPTRAGGIFEGWRGAYRAHIDGNLYPDTATLDCPNQIATFRLKSTSYIGSKGIECAYGEAKDSFELWVNLEPRSFTYPEGRQVTAMLARGEFPATRVTNLDKGDSSLVTDVLVVEGSEMELFVTCYQFEKPLDPDACHAVQAAFFSAVDPLSIGLALPN